MVIVVIVMVGAYHLHFFLLEKWAAVTVLRVASAPSRRVSYELDTHLAGGKVPPRIAARVGGIATREKRIGN